MRHRSATPNTDVGRGWTYSETIDEESSAIRVRGRVGRLAVDLLRGTIEELSRRGHRHITVTIEHPDDVDTCARAVLAEVAARLAGCGGRLTIQWSADEDGSSADLLGAPGQSRLDECGPSHGRETSERRLLPG
jgi:hypothetical protein